ncbi:MAG: hypothetical protein LBR34_09235 [Prevotella sp.]|jgi:hypothetical protein|nr:hypothetical protein [Prevotella sp.]
MGCRLQASITKENCLYAVAGVKALYLFNYDSANAYEFDDEGALESITLSGNSAAYKIDFADASASWSDELTANSNGSKYRKHTVSFTLNEYSYQVLNQGDALSLGKFTAVVVDKAGQAVMLGRNNGLSATSFNYASGAADADASGWTTVLSGAETEIGKRLTGESVIASLVNTGQAAPETEEA